MVFFLLKKCLDKFLNVKALVSTFNQEIVKTSQTLVSRSVTAQHRVR